MFDKLFGMGREGGCGCGLFGHNSSCDVLILLVLLFVLFNCGLLDCFCGIDLCTIAILLLFFCVCRSKKHCHTC
ncbi:MAG: hypothetical protein FWE53_02255 [Firmicutes bacterium]|nr:hypothetical protein [Bacillota bacterium]